MEGMEDHSGPQQPEKIIRVDATKDGKPSPVHITVMPGQILELHFGGTNYSAAMGDFHNPCQPSTRSNELQGQGIKRLKQFRETGDADDLNTGAQLVEAAFDESPDYYQLRGIIPLYLIGESYYKQYKKTGAIADLEIAIRLLNSVSTRAPKDHPTRFESLLILGIAHGRRHQRTAAIDDLDTGVRILEDALSVIPYDHELRGFILHNIATLHGNKHLARGARVDLEASLRRYREALDATPKDEANQEVRARRLAGLGTVHMNKFDRTGSFADLGMAIQYLQEALDLTPTDGSVRAQLLLQIADLHHARFQTTQDTADLDIVIRRSEEALRLPQNGIIYRARCLNRLGSGHLVKYDNSPSENRVLEDLDIAILRFQEALDITPDDFVLRTVYLQGLSRASGLRFIAKDSWADYEVAVQAAKEAINNTSSSAANRLAPARQLLTLYSGAQRWQDAYEVACTAMSLIALLTPRSLKNSDKQSLLGGIGDLASHAAAVVLEARKPPYEAIRLLELGRGIIVNSLHESRIDISDLQDKHSQLAAEYIRYRAQVDAPQTSSTSTDGQPYHADQRLAKVIEDIRRQPGFDRFLLPPTEDQIKEAAFRGPIVIINVSLHSCDALIIQEKKPLTSLPLPLLRYDDASERGRYTPRDPELLEWLWDAIAEPVLGELGFTQTPPDGRWPRIWWIPTGPLARLPLHAAGRPTDGSCNTVLDRVISSYSSSVQTLIYSRQKQPKSAFQPSKVVLLAMPQTAGQRDLVHVANEISQLEKLCTAIPLDVNKPQPVQEEVVAALRDCDIFHFAGHGHAHPQDPAKSSLLPRDGPLTVESFFDADTSRLQNRRSPPVLAYLSACGTGQVRDAKLIDEGMHLISACQLVGFQHVIGTLWEVNDRSCVDMATATYEWMMQKPTGISGDSVSEGLHRAVRSLRAQWISHNKATGALRRYHVMRGQDMRKDGNQGSSMPALEKADGGQSTTEKGARQVEECDDETLSPLYWVPYVHFGV
ncbi:hypothetical protein DL765_001278 [Monosporascus sp. GIB2]|nr:hypothetical protein DL765_001278 [Monosporascus sp. GIB2]